MTYFDLILLQLMLHTFARLLWRLFVIYLSITPFGLCT